MSERVEQLPLSCKHVGEGPHWLEAQQALVFVDTPTKTLNKLYVETNNVEVLRIDGGRGDQKASVAIPVDGAEDLWLAGLGNNLVVVSWPSSPSTSGAHTFQGLTATPTVLHTIPDDHFNDAKCDPRGRLWIGTMSDLGENFTPFHPRSCHLYRYDENFEVTTWAKDLSLSNGLAWSSDRRIMYFSETHDRCIYQFDYDDETGNVSNQRVTLDFKKAGLKLRDQAPDGITIDQNDNLWIACLKGSQVLCIDPRRGEIIRRVKVPAKFTTSVCWGGKDYSTLYVTSGHMGEPDKASQSGGTFAITGLGVKGSPHVSFKTDVNKLRAKMAV